VAVGFARAQNAARERWLVRRIGEILGFQAKTAAATIADAISAFGGSVKEIAHPTPPV